jgi:hypothetical protein
MEAIRDFAIGVHEGDVVTYFCFLGSATWQTQGNTEELRLRVEPT